jgi:GNAT superfamily N-acetyltransferase
VSNFQGLYKIRPYKESDKKFILATFLRGLYYGDFFFNEIPKNIFMDNYKFVAEKLITSKTNTVVIACLPDDEDVILAYSIMSSNFETIHWIYVKAAWRKQGIGKSITPLYPTYVSHLSKLGKELLKTKYKETKFNPFYV